MKFSKSRNHLKSIAIDQESLINNLGKPKPQDSPGNIKKQEKQNYLFPSRAPMLRHWSNMSFGMCVGAGNFFAFPLDENGAWQLMPNLILGDNKACQQLCPNSCQNATKGLYRGSIGQKKSELFDYS